MASNDNLEALEGLHRDVLAASENRLKAIERLAEELESRIEEFRAFLDQKSKNDTSRKKLVEGKSQPKSLPQTATDKTTRQNRVRRCRICNQ